MKIVEYIQKHKRLFIVIACLIVLLFIAKSLFDTLALVDIKVTMTGNQTVQNVKVYASSDDGNTELGGAGLKIIPRSTKSLVATKDEDASSQVKIKIPWYGYLEKKITLQPSKNADKIAYLNTNKNPCATYSIRLASLLAYDCKKPRALIHYDINSPIWAIRRAGSLPFESDQVAPYMGGVIGIESGTEVIDSPLLVVKDDGTKSRFNLPDGVAPEYIKQTRIFTNGFSATDNRFVIVDYIGDIYLGTPSTQNKTVKYRKITRPEGYSSTYQQTHCRMLGDFVYCYRGQYIRGDMPPSSVKLPTESILTASFTSDDTTSTNLDKPGKYSDFYVTLDGDMYAKEHKKLFYLSQTGDLYKSRELAQNVDAAAGGEGMFYIQKNNIYHVSKDSDAIMRFYSRNVLPKSLYVSEGSVFVLANVKDMGSNFYAYKLNDQDYTGENRLIDQLPAGTGKLPSVTYQDLVGNRAQFTIAVPINKTTRRGIDMASFEGKKTAGS